MTQTNAGQSKTHPEASHSPPRPRHREQAGDNTPPDATTQTWRTSTSMREHDSNPLPNFCAGRWRIVGAWTSLRRSLDGTRMAPCDAESTQSTPHATSVRPVSHHHDGTGGTTPVRNSSARASGRKQVSVFLRRRRSAQPFKSAPQEGCGVTASANAAANACEAGGARNATGGCAHAVKDSLRRAKSNVVHPVSSQRPCLYGRDAESGDTALHNARGARRHADGRNSDNLGDKDCVITPTTGGADVTHSQTPAGTTPTHREDNDGLTIKGLSGTAGHVIEPLDDEREQDLQDISHNSNDHDDDDEDGDIVGEICLEDFADLDVDDDFEFLDGQSIDLSFEPVSTGTMGRLSRRRSLKLENNNTVRWIGDEKEFAKFFAEVGLDELLDGKEDKWASFKIDERVEDEWRASAEEHNRRCEKWTHPVSAAAEAFKQSPIDIRDLAEDFGQASASRKV